MKIVVIIPTYNERENIAPVADALVAVFQQLPDYEMHILFVDDNSPDKTADAVRKLTKKLANIHLIVNKRKGGLGHAYKKGMQYALERLRADIVFEFDADLSHDPRKIPAFLDEIEQGSDMVLGSRYRKGGGIPPDWPIIRKFLSRVGNVFINVVLLDFSLRDWTTGYRAIHAHVVRAITPNLQHSAFNGYTWQIGFLIKTLEQGFKVSEVPFHFKDRTRGKSKLGPEYIINTMAYILKVRIASLIRSRIFKFALVGSIGALVQLTSLQLWRRVIPESINWGLVTTFQIAFFSSIETAIVSNFILSNIWTFADRKLHTRQIPGKFLAFNLASGGSIAIQQAIAVLGENLIGLFPLFTLHASRFTLTIDTGIMYAVTGILIGMFWNYFAYSRIIWKKK